jgi:hypothetical protein
MGDGLMGHGCLGDDGRDRDCITWWLCRGDGPFSDCTVVAHNECGAISHVHRIAKPGFVF